MSISAVSGNQFNRERNMIEQSGDSSELINRVRGFQHMTSNIFTPSFSHDLVTVRGMPSGTEWGGGGGVGGED